MLRVAVIGAGRIGRVHSRSIAAHPQAELSLICDPIGTAAADLAAEFGARSCLDAAEVFADPDIDAVVIGSPSTLHAEQVLAAAKAGKAVLCEKPISISVEQGRQLEADLAAFEHPPVMVGFQRRFDPSMRKAHDLVARGAIGAVEQLAVFSRDPSAPPASYVATSGGIFKDCTIHDFDIARFFMGEVASVTAIGSNFNADIKEAGDFDAVAVVVTAKSGAVAQITNNRHCAAGYDQRLEVHGETGSLMVDNQRPTMLTVNNAQHTAAQDPYLDYFLTRYIDAYRDELTAFIDAINNGSPVSPTVADGVAALELAEAAAESARTGRTVHLG